jgi:predicted kinase
VKIIFDLDGTIADIGHRTHFVRGGNKDWDSFFAACVDDIPNWPVVRALEAHRGAGHTVEIWSARSDIVRLETEAWLDEVACVPSRLLTRMRSVGDSTPDVVLKRYWLNQLHESERPDIVYDDRQRVVDMWREEGVACFQVAANWEAPKTIGAVAEPLLTLLVGPSGAGKSTYAQRYQIDWVLSSDALRTDYTGNFRDQCRNEDVFTALHRLAKARMDCGLPVVIDATNLRRRDRLSLVALVPNHSDVEYVVIDRPLSDKIRDAGWRSDVQIKGKSLIETHHERFKSCLKDIMNGDGLPQVRVTDERQVHSTITEAELLRGLEDMGLGVAA